MERNGMNLFRVEKARINEVDKYVIVTGKQIGRASCRERVSSPV